MIIETVWYSKNDKITTYIIEQIGHTVGGA